MSRTESLRNDGSPTRRRAIAAVGYVAVALALLTAFGPTVGDVVVGTVGVVVGSPIIVVLVGLAGGAYGLVQLYRTGRNEMKRTPLVALEPERAHYSENHVVGADIDGSIEAVGGELPESAAKNWWTYREKNDVTTAMVSVTVDVLASEHDVSRDAAAEMVEDGTWTDDERAAAFLGGSDAATIPLRVQFFDWLSGAAYERRAEATIDAIAAHAGLNRTADEGSSRVGAIADEDATDGSSRTTDESDPTDWAPADTDVDSALEREASETGDRSTPESVVEGTETNATPYPFNDGGGKLAWNGGDDE